MFIYYQIVNVLRHLIKTSYCFTNVQFFLPDYKCFESFDQYLFIIFYQYSTLLLRSCQIFFHRYSIIWTKYLKNVLKNVLPGGKSFESFNQELFLTLLLFFLLSPLTRQSWFSASLASNIGNFGSFRDLNVSILSL
jgi:hypothetical protein